MMKPYPESDLTIVKRIYNDCTNRLQRISENLFGILEIDGESFTQWFL